MPVPVEYQRATDQFYKFLDDAREAADLVTNNQSYTMVQGVFQTFRRRLDIPDAIQFANVLPALLRALFVSDWDVLELKRPFENWEIMTKEVQDLRSNHNFSPDTAIKAVAQALRKNVDIEELDKILAKLPKGAAEFWH
jgi:uncharacterized protein (DUF2267 family)